LCLPGSLLAVWYNAVKADISPKCVEKEVKPMAKEKAPKRIDISRIPELLHMAQEVRRTNESRILQQEREDLAILSPILPKKQSKTKAQPVTSDDALFRLIGIGKSGIPGGVSGKKHEYLARDYRPGNPCTFLFSA
jgi:hypothetical protein